MHNEIPASKEAQRRYKNSLTKNPLAGLGAVRWLLLPVPHYGPPLGLGGGARPLPEKSGPVTANCKVGAGFLRL
jgi:hypothetical protein